MQHSGSSMYGGGATWKRARTKERNRFQESQNKNEVPPEPARESRSAREGLDGGSKGDGGELKCMLKELRSRCNAALCKCFVDSFVSCLFIISQYIVLVVSFCLSQAIAIFPSSFLRCRKVPESPPAIELD